MELGQLINIAGGIIGALPSLIVMVLIYHNRGEPWRISNFLNSLILIGLSAFMIGLLSDLAATVERLYEQEKISESVFSQLRSSGAIWLALFPIVTGGVGINVLS